ncbi:MAG: amino acid permease [Flavobacteriales bacterium]|nr:amino acid permease [Flavobacteriales bacterium]
MSEEKTSLKRSLGLGLLILYGVGTMLGAGIYVLVGKVAGYAGMHAPLSFIAAAIVAAFTALSYSQLSSMIPKSAGEVAFVEAGFKKRYLASIVGWLVVFSGVVSSASLATGFAGYLDTFIVLPHNFVEFLVILVLGLVAIWGIQESIILASVISIIEVGGLILIIVVSGHHLSDLPQRWEEVNLFSGKGDYSGFLLGSFLAFFAFIGFEDLANIAEESKNPQKNLPISILVSLAIVTVLYIVISLISVLALPLDELAASDAPLADIVKQESARLPAIMSVISMIAVVNGVLIQVIMCSRVLYGMSRQGLTKEIFGRVSKKTRTPIQATTTVLFLVLFAALLLPIVTLANTTSYIILFVFVMVNGALILLHKRKEEKSGKYIRVPKWVPWVGLTLCLFFLVLKTYIEITGA